MEKYFIINDIKKTQENLISEPPLRYSRSLCTASPAAERPPPALEVGWTWLCLGNDGMFEWGGSGP